MAAHGERLQVAVFQMLAEVARIERFTGCIGDQRVGRETAAVAPDVMLQPVEQRLQIAGGDVLV